VKKAITILWKLPPDVWTATQKGIIQFYIDNNPDKQKMQEEDCRATDPAGTGTVPTNTQQQYQEPLTPGLQSTICRRMGELHERVDRWTMGKVHTLPFTSGNTREGYQQKKWPQNSS
jgi:hypothetical protein